jgi:prepilin-type N-terminal cleavage/methylation domain-containing protein
MMPLRTESPGGIKRAGRCGGFTLVELLVVTVIGAVLAMSVVAMFVTQTRTMALNEDLVDLEQNLRLAMDMVHRDVRMAGLYSLSEIEPFGIGPLDCNGDGLAGECRSDGVSGGPHALGVRYAESPGLEIVNKSGINTFVCSGGTLKPPGGPLTPVALTITKNPVYADITSQNNFISVGVGCPGSVTCPVTQSNPSGKCDNVTSPYGTVMSGAVPANPVGGYIWGDMNYVVYSVSDDYDCNGTTDGDVALRRINKYGNCGIVAFGVNDLDIAYILEDGTETFTVTDLDTLAEQQTIRKVRITISGETRNEHAVGGGVGKRTRSLTTEVLVRNLGY